LSGHGRTAVQIGHTQDPLAVDTGVPGAAEAHVDATPPPADPGPEESGPIRIGIVRVRGDGDDLMPDSTQMIHEDAPATLRGAHLGIVIVAEQDDPHTSTASLSARRFS